MRVDWPEFIKRARPEARYQLFPDDRVFVEADSLIDFDNLLAKIIGPIERGSASPCWAS